MAIAVQLDFKGGTLAQYDEVIKKMDFNPGGPSPPGGIFHWAMKTADGFRLTDVWESKEAFEKFSKEKIGPFSKEVGLPPPTVQFFEVHSYRTSS